MKKLGSGEKLKFTHEPFSQKILPDRPLTLPLSPESGGEGGGEGDFFTASPSEGGGKGGSDVAHVFYATFRQISHCKADRRGATMNSSVAGPGGRMAR